MREGIKKIKQEIIPLFVIGMGGQSVVYLSYDLQKNKLLALKIAKSQSQTAILERETEILSMFKHKNIIRANTPIMQTPLDGRFFRNKGFEDKASTYFGMELSHLGSLYEYLLASEGGFSMCFVRYYALQMLDALEQVHDLGFVHRDLKLENLLLFEKGSVLKLCDFGCCLPNFNKISSKDKKQESVYAGTDFYIAPEVQRHEGFDEKSDIFSFGVCLYILAFGCLPFTKATTSDKNYRHIALGEPDKFIELIQSRSPKEINFPFIDLLIKLWSFDPQNRPSIEEIRQNKWFAGDICDPEEACEMIGSMKQKVRINYVKNLERMKQKKVPGDLGEKLESGLIEITKV